MNSTDFTNPDIIRKYETGGPISYLYVTFPALIEILGEVKNKKILDLGCGSGLFANMLGKKGAKVTGIDISEEWIKFCKKKYPEKENLEFFVTDATNMKNVTENTFDIVVMSMVIINIKEKDKLEKIFKEISRVLKKDGSLIFNDIHPICLMFPKTSTDQHTYPQNFSYFKDGSKFASEVVLANYSKIKYSDVHWTLETPTNLLKEYGMYMEKIIEPQPIKDAPEIFKNYKIPEVMVFYCKKLSGRKTK